MSLINVERLAGNTFINSQIHAMLGNLDPADVPRFTRKFRSDSDEQCFHTYRELVLGAHLRACGWNLRYEHSLGGRTPDWVLLDGSGQVAEILDVVTLHQRRVVDRAIGRAAASHHQWVGWISTEPERLYAKLREKARAYALLAEQVRLPYIVAVFSEFTAPIEPAEVHRVVHEHQGGLFAALPALAGIIFFRERLGRYEYHHFAKSKAPLSSQILRGS